MHRKFEVILQINYKFKFYVCWQPSWKSAIYLLLISKRLLLDCALCVGLAPFRSDLVAFIKLKNIINLAAFVILLPKYFVRRVSEENKVSKVMLVNLLCSNSGHSAPFHLFSTCWRPRILAGNVRLLVNSKSLEKIWCFEETFL